MECIQLEVTACEVRLIRHDHNLVTGVYELTEAFEGVRRESDGGGVDVVGHVFQQCAVLVQKYCTPHGQLVSRIGIAMTSGTTVSGGCISTKRTVSATFSGGCRVSESISGKRS